MAQAAASAKTPVVRVRLVEAAMAEASSEPPAPQPVIARLPRPRGGVYEERPLLLKTSFGAEPPALAAAVFRDDSPVHAEVVAQATTPKPAPPEPTYRTKPPAAATVAYRLTRGAIVGSGEITWQPEAGGYRLQLEGRVPVVGTLITQVSRGRLDATGLAPERFTDRRLRRGEQAANFDRTAGRIGFSGQQPDVPLTPGVQDRVSVMLQLAAIANAWTRTPPVGELLRLRVVGARGDAHLWALRFEGPQAVETPDGRVSALRFLREPDAEHDTRAEFWLDPGRQFLPVKVVLTDDRGDALELLRIR